MSSCMSKGCKSSVPDTSTLLQMLESEKISNSLISDATSIYETRISGRLYCFQSHLILPVLGVHSLNISFISRKGLLMEYAYLLHLLLGFLHANLLLLLIHFFFRVVEFHPIPFCLTFSQTENITFSSNSDASPLFFQRQVYRNLSFLDPFQTQKPLVQFCILF